MADDDNQNQETERLYDYLENVLLIKDEQIHEGLKLEGLKSIKDFLHFSEDDMKTICNRIGEDKWIPNPHYDQGQEDEPRLIFYRGIPLGTMLKTARRLEQLRYYVHHLDRIQKTWDPEKATLERLERYAAFKNYTARSGEHFEPTLIKLTNTNDIEHLKTVKEHIDFYLQSKRGMSGVYLSYVVRDKVQVDNNNNDNDDENDNRENDDYFLMDEELVRRASHKSPYFWHDNRLVWQCLFHVFIGSPLWYHISPYRWNGRAAYKHLQETCFGYAFRERIRQNAQHVLDTARYNPNDESSPSFLTFSSKLSRAFSDLEEYSTAVYPRQKTMYLINAIRDWKPVVDCALGQIDLHRDYDEMRDMIARMDAGLGQESRRSDADVGERGGGGGRRRDWRGGGRSRKKARRNY